MMKFIPALALPFFSKVLFFIVLIIFCKPLDSTAQIGLSPNETYNQDFNGLPLTPTIEFRGSVGNPTVIYRSTTWKNNHSDFIVGWYTAMAASAIIPQYSSSSTGYIVHTNGKKYPPGNGILGMGPQNDLSLGSYTAQANANTVTGNLYFGVRFKNNSLTDTIIALDLSLYLEQWLDGEQSNSLLMQYQVASSPTTLLTDIKAGTWQTIGGGSLLSAPQDSVDDANNAALLSLDGNTVRREIKVTIGSITGPSSLSILPGYEYMIRWVDPQSGDNANRNDILAIDDLTVKAFGRPVVPLPVTLTSFKAQSREGKVELSWTTASEKDNDYFLVERSTDGKAFHALGRVKGNGNSSMLQSYAFTDASASAGTSYYRLKQVDFDGKSEFSKVIAHAMGKAAATAALRLGRNPIQELLSFTVQTPSETEAVVELRNMQGKVFHHEKLTLGVGASPLEIATSSLPQGIYILSVVGQAVHLSRRVMKIQ